MFKKLVTILFAVPLLLMGCGEEEKKTTSKKKLIMVTSADYPPFEFMDTSGGSAQVIGLDVDLARRIGEYLGYEIEVQDMDFAGIIPALQSGRADFAMAGMTPTEERLKSLSFSEIYYSNKNTLVRRSDNDFVNRKDFANTKIAVQLGSTQEQFARAWAQSNLGVTLVSLNRVNEAIQELIAGRIDGVILEETIANAYTKQYPSQLTSQVLEGESNGSAIAFAKDSELIKDFNAALRHLQEIGELNTIIDSWIMGD